MNQKLPVILVVDDSPEDRELLERLLRKAGVTNPVAFAADTEAAISVLGHLGTSGGGMCSSKPVMIFLDVNMPHGGGFRVLEWIRKEQSLRETCVVMVTDSSNPADIKRAEELKAGYLLKHPHPDTIAYVVRQATEAKG